MNNKEQVLVVDFTLQRLYQAKEQLNHLRHIKKEEFLTKLENLIEEMNIFSTDIDGL